MRPRQSGGCGAGVPAVVPGCPGVGLLGAAQSTMLIKRYHPRIELSGQAIAIAATNSASRNTLQLCSRKGEPADL